MTKISDWLSGDWPDKIRAGDYAQEEPLVRRVLAPNPSPYTYTGTQTWVVGAGTDVAVIDPGPYESSSYESSESSKDEEEDAERRRDGGDENLNKPPCDRHSYGLATPQDTHDSTLDSDFCADSRDTATRAPFVERIQESDYNRCTGHIEAILRAVDGRRVAAIICTHTHRDHSPAALPLKQRTGAPIIGCAPLVLDDDGPRADAAFDHSYAPDHTMRDGELISGDGWTLRTVATPGHTSNHLCYALEESHALFTGDHVMGWSTTVISPPDGDMAAYMASLAKLYARCDRVYYPAHGPAITQPQKTVRAMIGHRKFREKQIVSLLVEGACNIPTIVAALYKGLDPRLVGAAGRSVLAHLIDMEKRGIVRYTDDIWTLSA